MDLSQLEVFLTVAKERRFSRAAEKLYRTQSAISQSIRKLEEDVGEPLFDRSSREGLLTDAGRVLQEYAERLLNLRGDAQSALQELRSLHKGKLTIAANEFTALYLLPILGDFRRLHPMIKITVQRSLGSNIPDDLLRHKVELGVLTYDPEEPQLKSIVVYQDELILGFQSMIDENWSWGVRGVYRRLNNAIDDMEITSNGIVCDGEPGYVGFIMGNPGKTATVYTDTDCDGDNDAFVNIDTAHAGWAMYDDDGNYVGDRGFSEPKRVYEAIELMVDRAWDNHWSFNAVYTLSWTKGNAEGPVNSDTDFGDAGRTEAFDDPWVNYGAYGYLPNDRRHQLKVRGSYALNEHWEFGGALTVQSGRPISKLGECNPYDETCYWSFFIYNEATDSYELHPRGAGGTTPWLYDLAANVTYRHSFSTADLSVKLAVYNLLNQQRMTEVDEFLGSVPNGNEDYGIGTGYQAPRYGLLTLKLDF